MTVIQGLGPAGSAAPGRRPVGGASAFRVPLEGPAATTAPAGAEPALSGLLGLQERDLETVRDREARRHGNRLLGALATIQRGVLAGAIDPAVLAELARLSGGVPTADHPGLAAAVAAISMRAQVEMARLEVG